MSKVSHIHITTTPVLLTPKFHSVSLYHCLWAAFKLGYFEASAPNDPKMTLNKKRTKVHHILIVIPAPPSPKSYSVSLSTFSQFWVLGHLRRVHWRSPKSPEALQRKRYPVYMLQLPSYLLLHGSRPNFVGSSLSPISPNHVILISIFKFLWFFFFVFVNMETYMGTKMSKRYSYSFHPIWAKLYDKLGTCTHGGIKSYGIYWQCAKI